MASRMICCAVLLAAIVAPGMSCQNSGSTGQGSTQAQVKAEPVGSQSGTKVADGAAPLRFTFVAGGNVRVMDATTGERVARAKVPPNTTVRVDAAAGVVANDKELARGPLPADHQYEIWMDR